MIISALFVFHTTLRHHFSLLSTPLPHSSWKSPTVLFQITTKPPRMRLHLYGVRSVGGWLQKVYIGHFYNPLHLPIWLSLQLSTLRLLLLTLAVVVVGVVVVVVVGVVIAQRGRRQRWYICVHPLYFQLRHQSTYQPTNQPMKTTNQLKNQQINQLRKQTNPNTIHPDVTCCLAIVQSCRTPSSSMTKLAGTLLYWTVLTLPIGSQTGERVRPVPEGHHCGGVLVRTIGGTMMWSSLGHDK